MMQIIEVENDDTDTHWIREEMLSTKRPNLKKTHETNVTSKYSFFALNRWLSMNPTDLEAMVLTQIYEALMAILNHWSLDSPIFGHNNW